jgi:hypothetical protein
VSSPNNGELLQLEAPWVVGVTPHVRQVDATNVRGIGAGRVLRTPILRKDWE